MSSKKKLVLTLGLLAFSTGTWAARGEEGAVRMLSSQQEIVGICESPDLGKVPAPIFKVSCTCVAGGSVDCSGVGATCAAATSSFQQDCANEAELACSLDGLCSVTITQQSACQWTGSEYQVTGRARARCRVCP